MTGKLHREKSLSAGQGINKTDFTNLCMDPSFVFREDDLRKICKNMALTEEEQNMLLEAAGYEK